jgi:hypothetical protein
MGKCSVNLGKFGPAGSYQFQSFPLKMKKDKHSVTSLLVRLAATIFYYLSPFAFSLSGWCLFRILC